MAIVDMWLGSHGAFMYDDTAFYTDPAGVPIAPMEALYCPDGSCTLQDGNFTNVTISGLTAVSFVYTDSNKKLVSISGIRFVDADNVLEMDSGNVPGASISDGFKLYSADIVAGNAAPHFRTEVGHIVKLYSQAHIVDASTAHSITAPADTPADADALRDDLVNNTIPSIETALNNLGTKINSILTALENNGLLLTS